MPAEFARSAVADRLSPNVAPFIIDPDAVVFTPIVDLGVDVWLISLPPDREWLDAYIAVLDPEERTRADRFRSNEHRVRFVLAHGALRIALSLYLSCDPAEMQFVTDQYGKPALILGPDQPEIRFNLSHSGDVVIIGVTKAREIGVDVERIVSKESHAAIAERYFSPQERVALAQLSEPERRIGFFNCWTRKEAYIKARGEGLSIPLDGFDVSLSPGEEAELLESRIDPSDTARWRLREVPVMAGYVAAIAVETSESGP